MVDTGLNLMTMTNAGHRTFGKGAKDTAHHDIIRCSICFVSFVKISLKILEIEFLT